MRAFILSLILAILSAAHVQAQQVPSISEVYQWSRQIQHHLADENYDKARPFLWKMAHADFSAIDAGDEDFCQCWQDSANDWLGWMYIAGKGVSKDYKTAEKFLLKANGGGHSYRHLAWLYSNIWNDPKKAEEYQKLFDAQDN